MAATKAAAAQVPAAADDLRRMSLADLANIEVTTNGTFSYRISAMDNQAATGARTIAVDRDGTGQDYWIEYRTAYVSKDQEPYRTATKFAPGGPMVRFHIGLEDTGDLIADLERGFAALAAAR